MFMGRINFVAWLFWVLSPVGHSGYLEVCDFIQAFK